MHVIRRHVGTLANYASLEFEQNDHAAAQDLYRRYVKTTTEIRKKSGVVEGFLAAGALLASCARVVWWYVLIMCC